MEDLGSDCSFFGAFDGSSELRLRSAGFRWKQPAHESWSLRDAEELTEHAAGMGACGVVVDTYAVTIEYLARLRDAGIRVLMVDDFANLSEYPCDAVLNFTLRGDEFVYPSGPRLFIGPRWFLARRSVREVRAREARSIAQVRRILVSTGGNDPHDIVLPIVSSLHEIDSSLSVHVVVGASYAFRDELAALLSHFSGETIVRSGLPDLSEELAWADACVATAGLTRYEATYLGLPTGALSQNEGQALDLAKGAALSIVLDLGHAGSADSEAVRAEVTRLLRDASLRGALRRRCNEVFPIDPTLDLARTVLGEVFGMPPSRE